MQELLNALSWHYGFSGPLELEQVYKGYQTQNFVVTIDSRKFFLKQYRFRFERPVREVHAVMSFFHSRGVPVVMPIPTRDGKPFMSFGSTYYALFPFVSGMQFPRNAVPISAVQSLGAGLAIVHKFGRNVRGITGNSFRFKSKERFYEDAYAVLGTLKKVGVKNDFDTLAERSIGQRLHLARECNLSFAVVNDHLTHGDWHDGNVLFDQRGRIRWIYDFDEAYIGPRTYEIVRSLDFSCFNGNFGAEEMERAKVYLSAYHRVYPLSYKELQQGIEIYFYRLIHNLWIEKEHYLHANTKADSLLPIRVHNIDFLALHRDFLLRELSSVLERGYQAPQVGQQDPIISPIQQS